MEDIRWKQRFQNFQKALSQLEQAVNLRHTRELSSLEEQGLIKAFEYTYELSWLTLRDFLKGKGKSDLYGSRDVFREAFSLEILEKGEVWMEMIKHRNSTSHTYDEEMAEDILKVIVQDYVPAFQQLNSFFVEKCDE